MKIDFGTIIGIVIAAVLVFSGMWLAANQEIGMAMTLYIYKPASAAITIGGSVMGTMASFPFSRLKTVGAVFKSALTESPQNTQYKELILEMVDYATEARRNGVLALDARTEEISDPFVKNGIQLAVDGTAPEQIEDIMSLELEYLTKRHEDNAAIFLKWAELAPAFGLIGTLVGLVAMLGQLDDVSQVGPAMSIALITTLYGSMLANMFCIPIAGKLANRTKDEVIRKEIIISAILAIQSGDNPRIVKQKLLTYVTKKDREAINAAEATE
ncbi:motility protein A [Simkania negevensis]|uniref:Motility protein A n=1 Tax=Simkania negevensis TaxID=83561 RepID=A0ABS3APQ9_9BACT|nr:motility protein A [Simkania negevensis]